MTTRRSGQAGFSFLILLSGLAFYLIYLMLKPLLKTILLAAVLAILANPIYRRLARSFRGKNGLAALAACLVVTAIIIVPVIVLMTLLVVESLTLYEQASIFVREGGVQKLLGQPWVARVEETATRYLSFLGGQEIDLRSKLIQQLQGLSGFFIAAGQKAAANIAQAVGLFFILIFTLFFFFTDGERMIDFLRRMSPLPEKGNERLLERFVDVTKAAFLGTFGVSAAQGLLGGLAMALVGYQGIFWGFVMALCSLIPMVGAALIWVPAALILLAGGRLVAGLFIIIWGVGAISTVDNFLRPYLMKGKSGLHPLVILFSVLGGVQLFGMLGIVLGPLVAALGLTLLGMTAEQFGSGAET